MAKIFSKIAEKNTGLQQVYNDSTVQVEPLNYIRSVITNTPMSTGIFANDIFRIQRIYNLYATSDRQYIEFTANKLRIVPIVRKSRTSTIYDAFPANVNPWGQQTITNTPIAGTLIEIKPDSKDIPEPSLMRQDSQTLPIISGPRDEKRLVKYLKTSEGLKFLAQQQVLQAGNTFKQTRRYNPLSVPLATAKYTLASLTNPLERVSRMLSVDMQSSAGGIPQMLDVSDIAGRLQQETVLGKQQQLQIRFVGGQQQGSNRNTLLGQVIRTGINRGIQTIANRTNIKFFGRKVNLGQLGRKIGSLAQTAQAINRALTIDNATLRENQTAYDALIRDELWPLVKNKDGIKINFFIEKKNYVERAQKSLDLAKLRGKLHNNFFTKPYPSIEEDYRSSDSYTEDVQTDVGSINGVVSARYMKDPMNFDESGKPVFTPRLLDGKHSDEDFIKFKIIVPTLYDEGIYFRAFIQDFKHEAKGEYDEQRYVGRPERFVVYKGMSRSVSFSLYLTAFSKDELSAVWVRANMLNKLVYPVNSRGGYMTPPLVKMTLGNILVDQPGYVTDINMDLSDSTWDIDAEVTQFVKLTINFSLLEKNFITQTNANPVAGTDLFANQLITEQLDKTPILSRDLGININLPQIDLRPTNDPLSQENLRSDIQATIQNRNDRIAKEAIKQADRINNLLSRA
jgi:hypothetical protein